jgi:preprotein translocase subunit Sec63
MSSVEIFVVIVGCVFGYLIVSHFMGAKPAASDPPPPADPSLAGWDVVLQISRYASPDDIRKAYQLQITKYHPDKVAGLGEEFKAMANRKSQEINAAYAAARSEKGF